MIIRLVILLLVLGAVGAGFYLYKQRQEAAFAGQAGGAFPPIPVSSSEAKAENWRGRIRFVGSLRAVSGVAITPEVTGIVKKIHFESGQTVAAGDVLVELSADVERATMQKNRAALQLAQANLDRGKALIERKDIPKSKYDEYLAQYNEAAAELRFIQAQIEQKVIRSPAAGVVGIRRLNVGQVVTPETPVATLETAEGLYADMDIPQKFVSSLDVGLPIRFESHAYPDSEFSGVITTVSPQVDTKTRSVPVEAKVDESEDRLYPGMFVDGEIVLRSASDVVVVPQTAISYSLYGNTVFVIVQKDGGHVVEERPVKLGEKRGNFVAVAEGVKAGEMVVTSGQQKLRTGAPVVIDNDVDPAKTPTQISQY